MAMGLLLEDKAKIFRIPSADIPFGGTELPASFDLSSKMPEVGNQGDQQSCVAWAIAYAMKGYQENMQLGESLQFSPSFVYNQINGGKNAPTQVTDALNVLSEQGVCLMDEMPYNERRWTQEPSSEAKRSARRFRIAEWRRVNTVDVQEVKTHIAAGLPVIIGAMVSAEFRDDGFSQGADYVWKRAGTPIGGHAMLVVGYDDDKGAFKLMNSWGKQWGDGGFGWVDYAIFPDVVMYGFIAKDGYTSPDVVADIKRDDRLIVDEEDLYTENKNPTQPDTAIDFRQSNVVYNVQNPDKAHPGAAMRIEGTLGIPPRYGKTFYVLVSVYDAASNKAVASKIYPEYSNIDRNVAGYTQPYSLDDERMKARWWLHIPYTALDLPPGRADLYAVPTLFIDNFGVKNGERIDFWFEQPGEKREDNEP